MTERTFNSVVNADGLRQTYGTGEAQTSRGGTMQAHGGLMVTEVNLIGTELRAFGDATDPTTVLCWHTRLPESCFVEKAELQVVVDFVGATATLDIGIADANDQAYALTHTGAASDEFFDSAIAVTALQTADQDGPIALDGTGVSTQLPATDGGFLITAEAGTADFTAGQAIVRIFWRAQPVTAAL